MLLAGKTAMITGCNRGIGRAVLEKFAEHGANIWACVRSENETFVSDINRLENQYGVWIRPLYFDLTDQEKMKAGIREIVKVKQNIDILVHNAGMLTPNRLFVMTPLEDMKDSFETNFFAPMAMTQYIARQMIKQGQGSIVFVSSVTALDGEPAQLEYVAGKAALIGAVRKLSKEFGPNGIRVNAVAPGLVLTDMGGQMDTAQAARMIDQTALGRKGTPEDVAKVVLFLASDLSSYVTGQTLRVDGGM